MVWFGSVRFHFPENKELVWLMIFELCFRDFFLIQPIFRKAPIRHFRIFRNKFLLKNEYDVEMMGALAKLILEENQTRKKLVANRYDRQNGEFRKIACVL